MGSPGRVWEQALQVLSRRPCCDGRPISEHLGWGLSRAGGVLGGGPGGRAPEAAVLPLTVQLWIFPLVKGGPAFRLLRKGGRFRVLDVRELGHEGA